MKILMLLSALLTETPTTDAPDVQLLDFSASYCQPCQQMLPILRRMETDGFPIRQIDITEEHELARRFRIERVPTLIVMVEGKEVERFVGLRTEDELRHVMQREARRLSEKREAARPVNANPEAPKKDPTEESGKRPSIQGIFRNLFGSQTPEQATVRGQSPETSALTGLELANRATVRIRVDGKSRKDGRRIRDVGTGTIVYSGTGQAIVLTCAHFFLDMAKDGTQVEVEVFENGTPRSMPAKIIGGDHDSDLAFLQLNTATILPAVTLCSATEPLKSGEALVSFGCDDGSDPSRLETKLVDINRYDGPGNLVCTVDPKSGRSGGGLFNAKGQLVGVCSCADRKAHEGLYMAVPSIMAVVDKLQLQYVCVRQEPEPPVFAQGEDTDALLEGMRNPGAAPPQDPALPEREFAEEPRLAQRDGADSDAPPFDPSPTTPKSQKDSDEGFNPQEAPPGLNAGSASAATGTEVTIIIDEKKPGGQKKVIVIPQASAWLLEMLTGDTPME